MSEIAIVVAVDSMNGFAKEGKIPWHYPEDFKFFRNLTLNNICVMGKNTYLDINERLGDKAKVVVLPQRLNFVVTSTLPIIGNATRISDISVVTTFRDERYSDMSVFLIGGKQIFDEGLRIADTIYLTRIQKDYQCDLFFDMDYVYENFHISNVTIGEDKDLTFIKYIRNK